MRIVEVVDAARLTKRHIARQQPSRLPDMRIFQFPNRVEVLDNMWARNPLASLQLWEVAGNPVVIEQNGECRIFRHGEWRSLDPWVPIFHGGPLSYYQFQKKWPRLVSARAFLASFAGNRLSS